MLLKRFSFLVILLSLFSFAVQAKVNDNPKREFRGAWIQAVNGQFTGMSEDEMKKYLINMLNNLQKVNVNACSSMLRLWHSSTMNANGSQPGDLPCTPVRKRLHGS